MAASRWIEVTPYYWRRVYSSGNVGHVRQAMAMPHGWGATWMCSPTAGDVARSDGYTLEGAQRWCDDREAKQVSQCAASPLSGVASEPRGAVLGFTIPSPAFNEVFLKGYIRAALWSSNDESREDGGDPLDQNYSAKDLAKETLAKMAADCEAFIRANADDLWAVAGEYRTMAARKGEEDWWPSWMGHDFWLTRNGHGAGFFDRDLGEVGDRLTKASDRFPEVNLYVHRKRIYQG